MVSLTPDYGPEVPIESRIIRGVDAHCGDVPFGGGRDGSGRWDGTYWDGNAFVPASRVGEHLYELWDGLMYDAAKGEMYREPGDGAWWRLNRKGSGVHLWYRIRCLRPSCGYAQEIPGPSLVMALDWVLSKRDELAKQIELLPNILGPGDWLRWRAYPHPTVKTREVEQWVLDDHGRRTYGIWKSAPTLDAEISALVGVLRKLAGPMP